MFTNTFSLVPNIYNVKLGYNDAPSNTIKVHVQYPLQCYDKTIFLGVLDGGSGGKNLVAQRRERLCSHAGPQQP